MRRRLIVGNWKMNKVAGSAREFVQHFLARERDTGVDVAIAPPFTALAAVAESLRGTPVALAAQTMHWAQSGAYTGEISAAMLRDAGVTFVIIGHSERRAACAETDETVNLKVAAAHACGLIPIVAVGETLDEHLAGHACDRVVAQTRAAFAGIEDRAVARSVVAYEPIWAIGSGRSDDPTNANTTMGAIRDALPALADVRMLYGGSAKPENIAAFVARDNIDGALVGGASLDPSSFAALVGNAA